LPSLQSGICESLLRSANFKHDSRR
jgi:hypothetical protein